MKNTKKVQINKIKGFSLIEIIVSLAIFSFIFSIVIGISLGLVKAQNRVQEQIFLTQTAQTTLDSMSRSIRYGYGYTGGIKSEYESNNSTVFINLASLNPLIATTSIATTSQIISNQLNSPFILFEGQSGDPTSYTDQLAYCYSNTKLYKINSFDVQTNGMTFRAKCDTGQSILPDNVKLEFISFDVNGQSSENPKNPTVRIKLELSSESGEKIFMQTSVTQRLIQIL